MWVVRRKTYELEVVCRLLAEEKVEAQARLLMEVKYESSVLFQENQRLRKANEELRRKLDG